MNRRELLLAAAAAPAVLALPAAAHAAARGGTPFALVTSDSDDRVLVARLTDLKVVRALAVPDQPHGIEAVDQLGAALVLSEKSGTITVLDVNGLKVRRVLEGFAGPRYAAGEPSGGSHAYVSDDKAGQVIAIDVPRARVIGRVEVGEGARHISISPDGTRVVTSLGTKAPRLALVDVSRPQHPRSCARSRPTTLRTTSRSRRTAGSSGSARGPSTGSPCTMRSTLRPLRSLAGDAPPSTSRSTRPRGASTWRAARAGRCASTAWPMPGCSAPAACPSGRSTSARDAGRVVTPSLDVGTLTLLDHRGLRSVRIAPNAHDACLVVATDCCSPA